MTYAEFCTDFYNLFPQCTIQEDDNGEIIIFTKKTIRRCETEVDEVVDFEPEVCRCSDCDGTTDRECNCPHGMKGDHADTCWYAARDHQEEEEHINPPECYDDAPAPTKYLVARLEDRVSLLEHTFDALLTQKKTDLGLNLVTARQTFYKNDPN